jgi:isoleucyl-tRNA synthetase
MWFICEALVRLVAPIMSFTADEIWQYMPAVPDRAESVHLATFPEVAGFFRPDSPEVQKLRADYESLTKVRDEVLKALEEARNKKLIGSGLEAKVTISAPESSYELLERYREDLRALFIVSAVEVQRGPDTNGSSGIRVEISKAPGQKCERCWNYSPRVGEDSKYPTVCERCSPVLRELELSR